MAITRSKKVEVIAQYQEWFKKSKVAVITQYTGLRVKDLDALRAKVREAGGEFHVVKNTLGRLALKQLGFDTAEKALKGSTAIAFGFEDGAAIAKVMTDYAKTSDILKIKGGTLGVQVVSATQVQSLAELPPLPIMRAMLLGTILAPASQLVRVLAEPGRQVAAVIKAYADQDAAPAAE